MTSFRVMPKHVYEGGTVTEAEGRITCGPYVLESFNKEAGTITFAVKVLFGFYRVSLLTLAIRN